MVDRIAEGIGSSGDLVIPIEKVPVAAFQAIYHNLTKKTDFLKKSYKTSIMVDITSITDLHYHIVQSVSQYSVKASGSRVLLSLNNGESHDISSLDKFVSINHASFSASSTGLSITYDFLIIRPVEVSCAEDVSQRFKLSVNVTERPQLGRTFYLESPFSFDSDVPTALVCHSEIEYADIAVARNLQGVISEWVERSRLVEDNTISDKLGDRIRSFANYFIPTSAILMLLGSIFLEIKKYNNLLTPMRYLLVVLALTIGIMIVTGLASEKVGETTRLMQVQSRINLTSGDRIKLAELSKERVTARTSLAFVFVGVVVAFVVGLAVNYVSVKLLPN